VTTVIIIVVLAVGLPALAWWVAKRPFWATHRARPDQDFWTDILQTRRLDPVQMRQVAGAMSWGSRLPEPRLRRAVADWAERDVRRIQENRRHPSALRRRAVVAGLAGGLVVLGMLGFRLVAGESSEGDVTVLAVLVTLVVGAVVAEPVEQARLRRMIRRNTDEAAEETA
jgi:hypothetical protein